MTSFVERESVRTLAQEASREGKWEKAIQHWNDLIENFPLYARGYIGKANALIATNRLDEAEEIFKGKAVQCLDRVHILQGLTKVALKRRQWHQALDLSSQLVTEFPTFWQGQHWQGLALMELGKFDQAEVVFISLLERHPDRVQGFSGLANNSFRARQWQQTITQCDPLIKKFPNYLQGYVWKATACIELDEFEHAENLFRQVVLKFPQKEQGYKGLTQTAIRAQKWTVALDFSELLLKQFPEHLKGKVWRGRALEALGQLDQAEVNYRRIAQQHSDSWQGLHGLAHIKMKKGELESAIEIWNDLIVDYPDNFQNYIGKVNALKHLNEIDCAIATCEQALQVEGIERARIYTALGDLYLRFKLDLSTASTYYHVGLEEKPEDYELCLRVAALELKRGELAEAMNYLKEAIRIRPSHTESYRLLADVQYRMGKASESLQTLQECVQLAPSSPEAYKNLAHFQWFYFKNPIEAWQSLETAIKLDDNYLPALIEQACLLRQIGRIQAACQLLIVASQKFEYRPEGYIGLAQAELELKRYDQAIRTWQKVERKFPHLSVRAKDEQAHCLIKLNRLEEAEAIYNELCQQFPYRSEGAIGLAMIAEQRLQWESALYQWGEIVKQFPELSSARHRHIDILINLGEFDKAEIILKSLFDSLPISYSWCVGLYLRSSRTKEALSCAKAAAKRGVVEANGAILTLAIRLGKRQDVQAVNALFWNGNLSWCSRSVYKSLCNMLALLTAGQLREAWTSYLLLFEDRYGYSEKSNSRLETNSAVFVLCMLSFSEIAIQEKREDWIKIVVDHVCENQEVFECQPDLIAYIYFLYALLLKSCDKPLSLRYAKYSLSLNPDNSNCMSLVKDVLRSQHHRFIVPVNNFDNIHEECDRTALMIVTCQKYADKIPLLEERIYKQIDSPHYYVIGDPSLESDWKLEGYILYVKTPDNYESLSMKVFKAFEFFLCCSDYKGVMKLDDDCWISNINGFRSIIERLEGSCLNDYMGRINSAAMGRTWHFDKCELPSLNRAPYSLMNQTRYCAGGYGYYLSRRSLNILFEHIYKYPGVFDGELYEDVLIGKLLSYYQITPYPLDLVDAGVLEIGYDVRLHATDVQKLYEQAAKYVSSGRIEEAISLYVQMIEIDKDVPLHYYAELLQLARQLEEHSSIAAIEKLIRRRFPDYDFDSLLTLTCRSFSTQMDGSVYLNDR